MLFYLLTQRGRFHPRKGRWLALVKRFVELHGGSVSVESAVGQGSTFSFSLPVRQPASA